MCHLEWHSGAIGMETLTIHIKGDLPLVNAMRSVLMRMLMWYSVEFVGECDILYLQSYAYYLVINEKLNVFTKYKYNNN